MSMLSAVVRPEGGAIVVAATGRRAPFSVSGRLLESRVRVLSEIAERYRELTDPLAGGSGIRGTGEVVGLMPHDARCLIRSSSPPRCSCAYRSVKEFGRLVVRLRAEERELWRHLDGWWLSAETRTVFHCPRCGITHQPSHRHPSRRNSGKPVEVQCKRVVVWSRPAGVRESLAKGALEVLAGWWALESEPMLPEAVRV